MSDQGMTLEQLLVYVEQAARGDRRLLVQLFRTLQQLAHHPVAPPTEQRLGETLCLILMGDRAPDLTNLPAEMALEILAMLERLADEPSPEQKPNLP